MSVRLDFRPDRGKFCRAGDMERVVVVCKSGYEHTALVSCLSNVLDPLVVSFPLAKPPRPIEYWW